VADPIITNVDIGQIGIDQCDTEHGTPIDFAGADVLAAGTILARHTGTNKWQVYVKGGSSNGNGVAGGVLAYPVAATGAGDVPVDVIVRGTVNQDRLVIDADGDGSNVDAAVIDLLRGNSILAKPVKQLSKQDNQ